MYNSCFKLCLAVLIILVCAGCQSPARQAAFTPTMTYVIPHIRHAPLLDGKLDEAVWRSAPSTRNFVIHNTGEHGPITTSAKLLYDDAYLYIGFTTTDADIYARYTSASEPLFFRDDLVEIFIDPLGTGKNYLEFGVSANATRYSLIIPKAISTKIKPKKIGPIDLHAATEIHGTLNQKEDIDKSWSVEIRISLTDIQTYTAQPDGTRLALPIPPGTRWKMGLFRIDYDHRTPYNQANGYYSWQHLGGFGFHRPLRFGTIEFGARASGAHNSSEAPNSANETSVF